MIRLRGALAGLQPYQPGKPAELVARIHQIQNVVKLASNECPYPPLPSVQETIARAAAEANRYPDDDCTALREALALRHGVEPAGVAVGCGSIDVCFQAVLATTDPGEEILFGWPTFNAYPLLADLAGGVSRPVPLRDERLDLEALADRIGDRTRLVILCNPNNPTGTIVGREALERFMGRVPDDLLVVIDEAYRDFVDDPEFPDGVEWTRRYDNLLVLRTFSKAHGLAGLRIGYGISGPDVIGALRKVHMPFGVNRVAQAAALASLAAESELEERVQEVIAEGQRVSAALAALGRPVRASQANFVCLPVAGRAEQIALACEARGVVIRPMGHDVLRVTIGTPAENDRFLGVFAGIAKRATA